MICLLMISIRNGITTVWVAIFKSLAHLQNNIGVAFLWYEDGLRKFNGNVAY